MTLGRTSKSRQTFFWAKLVGRLATARRPSSGRIPGSPLSPWSFYLFASTALSSLILALRSLFFRTGTGTWPRYMRYSPHFLHRKFFRSLNLIWLRRTPYAGFRITTATSQSTRPIKFSYPPHTRILMDEPTKTPVLYGSRPEYELFFGRSFMADFQLKTSSLKGISYRTIFAEDATTSFLKTLTIAFLNALTPVSSFGNSKNFSIGSYRFATNSLSSYGLATLT